MGEELWGLNSARHGWTRCSTAVTTMTADRTLTVIVQRVCRFWRHYELVDVSLAWHFLNYILGVIISKRTA